MKIAVVFPGQGSHSVGMLRELALSYPVIEQTFAQASTVLGYDLWQVCSDGPQQRLDMTAVTQPAMLAADVAMWTLWQSQSGECPQVMAGHSLGEYSALVAAGAISFVDAVRLVALRGQLMQEAVPAGQGAMAAIIGASKEQVIDLCEQASEGEVVTLANDNAPGQVVIAGHAGAVQRAVKLAPSFGARKAIQLAVSVPAHCQLMHSAVDSFQAALHDTVFSEPSIPVIHNVDLLEHEQPDSLRHILLQQLTQPVRWVETVSEIAARGIESCVECGPGKVLVGLNKRIAPALAHYSINTPELLEQTLGLLQEGIS